ncbi:MAG: penicillin-binding protein activator [Pelagibacteraceae bacterium]|nr:penicillin-binding protein activator [Pelagibacteraceae bacterium]
MSKLYKILLFLILNYFFLSSQTLGAKEKIKIGLLVPTTGSNKELGQSIIKAVILAVSDIDNDLIEIVIKDTNSDANKTLKSAIELKEMGVQVIIGPVFHQSLIYLNQVKDVKFLSLTNKTIDLPENTISAGVNSTSQLLTIKKFLDLNNIKKTIFLTPILNYEAEIKKGIEESNIIIFKEHIYDPEPTKLTRQIEEITNYNVRKQNLKNEIYKIEKSNDINKEQKIKDLEKKYTIGNVNFDAVIISDFDENLKSVATSLLYTDILPTDKYFITLNQWFDESLLREKDFQPIYYPSINKKNFDDFKDRFFKKFNENPNHLSLLSYDLVGLVYYLSSKNKLSKLDRIFKKKNSFRGKTGIFNIKDNKIYHQLNFYKIQDNQLIEIF